MMSSRACKPGVLLLLLVVGCREGVDDSTLHSHPTIDSLEVLPRDVILRAIGETTSLLPVARNSEGRVFDVSVSYASLNPDIVHVDHRGNATAKNKGEATISVAVNRTSIITLHRILVDPLPHRLVFVQQPDRAEAGVPFLPHVEVSLVDANGHPVKGWKGDVEIYLVGDPTSLAGERFGAMNDGEVAFPTLFIESKGEGRKLQARMDGFEAVESAPFSVGTGPQASLTFEGGTPYVQPGASFSPVVVIQDKYGNVVPASGMAVELRVDEEVGALEGTLIAQSNEGKAKFGPLRMQFASRDGFRTRCYEGEPLTVVLHGNGLGSFPNDIVQRLNVAKSSGTAFLCLLHEDGTSNCPDARGRDGYWNREGLAAIEGEILSVHSRSTEVCALTKSGQVFCSPTTDRSPFPKPEARQFPTESRIISLEAGYAHFCALTDEGEATCWGSGWSGQLGNGRFMENHAPTPIPNFRFKSLSVGESHSCGITDAGALVCWGTGSWGELGDGGEENRASPVEVRLPLGENARWVSAGAQTSCVITTSERVYCWGQLYDPEAEWKTSPSLLPTEMQIPSGLTLDEIHAGNAKVCLLSDGDVYCWGYYGKVGYGLYGHSLTPTEMILLPEPEKIKNLSIVSGKVFVVSTSGRPYLVSTVPEVVSTCPSFSLYAEIGGGP